MSTISFPMNKAQNIIGRIGEKLIEEYFIQQNIMIVSREFHLSHVGARADFIVTKNLDKKEKFWTKLDEIKNASIDTRGTLLEVFKGRKYTHISTEKLMKLREEISEKYPKASVFYIGGENSLSFYDLRPKYKMEFNFIKENYCIVEVKTSGADKFPRITGKGVTLTQKESHYYDHILRIKLIRNFQDGFSGIIHKDDLEKLLNDPKLV